MINILADIAKDQKIVNALKVAIMNGTLLKHCPFDKLDQRPSGTCCSYCAKVCHKIWPDLKDCCPCNKTDREAIVHAIIAISNVFGPSYRYGDVFSLDGRLFILLTVDGDHYSLVDPFTKDNLPHFWTDAVKITSADVQVNKEELKQLMHGANFIYCGHISELTIKNGRLVD